MINIRLALEKIIEKVSIRSINFSYSNIEDINANNPKYFKNQYGVNLVKLHGGLNELTYKDKKQFCNLSLDVKNSEELMQNFKNMMQMNYIFHSNGETPSSSKRLVYY